MMPFKWWNVGALAGLVVLQAWGGPAAEVQPIAVPVCDKPPQLDAELTDPAWSQALKLTGFHRVGNDQPPEAQTTVWLCRDDTWFYIAFRCDENKAGAVVRSATRRDSSLGKDDSVEVFLDRGTGGKEYFHFQLTAGNVQADQYCTRQYKSRNWDLPWRSAAKLDPHIDTAKGWSAEMALPLAMLQEGGGSKPWTINFCRSRNACAPTEYTSLAVLPPRASFHTPEVFIPILGLSDFKARTPFGPMLDNVAVLPLKMTNGCLAYGLEVKVKNKTGKAGAVEVVGEDRPQTGAAKPMRRAVELGPMDEKTVELWFGVESLGQRAAWVGLREPGTEFWLQKVEVSDLDRLRPFDAYAERNYYTTESNALVWVEIRTQPADRVGLRIRAVLADGQGQALQTQEADAQADEVSLPFALKDLPAGTYPVTVSLALQSSAPVKETPAMGSLRVNLKKLPPSPWHGSEVKLDQYNRCLLLNGEPFFPLGENGIYWRIQPGWREDIFMEQLRYSREAGWNIFSDWAGYSPATNAGLADIKQRYDLAAAHGLKIIGRAYGDGANHFSEPGWSNLVRQMIADMDPYLEYCRQNTNMITYYHFDEPPGPAVMDLNDILQAFADKTRRLDPYHPVYMSVSSYIYAPEWFGTVTDLLGTHNYWSVHQPETLQRKAEYFEQKDRLSRQAHLPTISVVQNDFWGISYGNGGFMTPHEMRALSYLALIHGARMLIYFGIVHRAASVPVYRQLSSEIMALAPALLKREPRQETTWSPAEAMLPGLAGGANIALPVLQTSLREFPDGRQVLLAMNCSYSGAVTVQYAVSTCAEGAAVESLFAGVPPLKVSGGKFTDTLEPFGVRVYQWMPAGPAKAAPVRVRLELSGPAVDDLLRKPAPDGAGANLLANPGFETATDWERLQRSTETVCAGAQAAVLVKTNSNGVLDVVSAPVTLAPQTSYRFGGWVKADLREGRQLPYIFVFSKTPVQGVTRVNTQAVSKKRDDQWQELRGAFTTPADPAEVVQVFLRMPPGNVGTAWFDDVYLRALPAPKPPPKNLVRNSSFERARVPEAPDLWQLFGLQLEAGNPFHGKYCAKFDKKYWDYGAFASSTPIPIRPGQPYALSFYARTDDPEMSLRVYGSGKEPAVFKPGPEWRRFSLTLTPQRSPWTVQIHPGKMGCFYLDAVQLEEGEQATDYEPDDDSQ